VPCLQLRLVRRGVRAPSGLIALGHPAQVPQNRCAASRKAPDRRSEALRIQTGCEGADCGKRPSVERGTARPGAIALGGGAGLKRSGARHIGIFGRPSRQDSRPMLGSHSATPPQPAMGNRSRRPAYREHACSPIPGRRFDIPRIGTAKHISGGRVSSASSAGPSSTPTSSDLARRTDPPARSSRARRSRSRHPAQGKGALTAALRPTNEVGWPSAR